MNKNVMRLALCSSLALLCACNQPGAEKKVLTTAPESEQDKISYVVGLEIGTNFKQLQTDLQSEINLDLFLQGLKTSLKDETPLMNEQQIMTVKQEISNKIMEQRNVRNREMLEQRKELGEKNKTEGDKFLAENKTKEGVKTTASGLQYMVLSEGKGAKPTKEDRVSVHYKGTLLDGTEFDSSYKRNAPTTFALTQIIAGWTEGLQLMKEGSKYRFFIPSNLAYGERGAGAIGPNATLIFEIELLGIEKGK